MSDGGRWGFYEDPLRGSGGVRVVHEEGELRL
jgi:hypothetical protein